MRLCRVCLAADTAKTFSSCFDENGLVARIIYSLFDIKIIEESNFPAVICRKCYKYVLQAESIKKQILDSEKQLRIETKKYELETWNKNIQELKSSQPSSNELTKPVEKVEEIDSDTEDIDEIYSFIEQGKLDKLKLEPIIKNEIKHDDLIENSRSEVEKHERNLDFIDSLMITDEQLETLTEQIKSIIPVKLSDDAPTSPALKLKINLKKLRRNQHKNRNKHS